MKDPAEGGGGGPGCWSVVCAWVWGRGQTFANRRAVFGANLPLVPKLMRSVHPQPVLVEGGSGAGGRHWEADQPPRCSSGLVGVLASWKKALPIATLFVWCISVDALLIVVGAMFSADHFWQHPINLLMVFVQLAVFAAFLYVAKLFQVGSCALQSLSTKPSKRTDARLRGGRGIIWWGNCGLNEDGEIFPWRNLGPWAVQRVGETV